LRKKGEMFGFVYLGFNSPRLPVRCILESGLGRRIYQVGGASTTHAYLVNQMVMRRLLSEFPQSEADIWSWISRNVAIDRWYSLNLHRWTGIAAVSPQVAIQEPSSSDITQRTSDFNEDPNVEILQPLTSSYLAWRVVTLLRSIIRPVAETPRIIKAMIRRWIGF